jgi:hypothetical protein
MLALLNMGVIIERMITHHRRHMAIDAIVVGGEDTALPIIPRIIEKTPYIH